MRSGLADGVHEAGRVAGRATAGKMRFCRATSGDNTILYYSKWACQRISSGLADGMREAGRVVRGASDFAGL
jgi:hypothetical protein